MADGSFGERDIFIDLTVTGARVIKDATKGEFVKIGGIRINGTTGAGAGDITFRKESAGGPIVFQALGTASTIFDGTFALPVGSILQKGLYMDALGTAWTAGSQMIIYTN
jgi:hypothetical protein